MFDRRLLNYGQPSFMKEVVDYVPLGPPMLYEDYYGVQRNDEAREDRAIMELTGALPSEVWQ